MFHTLTFERMNVILQIEQNKSCFPLMFGRWTTAFPGRDSGEFVDTE